MFIVLFQNCTVWQEGSFGSGNLDGFQLIAYVASYSTTVADPSSVDSDMQEHDAFNFFGLDLTTVHDPNYSSYISGSTATPTSAPSSTLVPPSTVVPPQTSSSSANMGTQTAV